MSNHKARQNQHVKSFTDSNRDNVQDLSKLRTDAMNTDDSNRALFPEQIDDDKGDAEGILNNQPIMRSESTFSNNNVKNIDPDTFPTLNGEDQHHLPVELKSEGYYDPHISSYIGRIYSHAEALEKAKNVDKTIEKDGRISDELIMLMFILLAIKINHASNDQRNC